VSRGLAGGEPGSRQTRAAASTAAARLSVRFFQSSKPDASSLPVLDWPPGDTPNSFDTDILPTAGVGKTSSGMSTTGTRYRSRGLDRVGAATPTRVLARNASRSGDGMPSGSLTGMRMEGDPLCYRHGGRRVRSADMTRQRRTGPDRCPTMWHPPSQRFSAHSLLVHHTVLPPASADLAVCAGRPVQRRRLRRERRARRAGRRRRLPRAVHASRGPTQTTPFFHTHPS